MSSRKDTAPVALAHANKNVQGPTGPVIQQARNVVCNVQSGIAILDERLAIHAYSSRLFNNQFCW